MKDWVSGSTWCPVSVAVGTGTKTWSYTIADSTWTAGTRYQIISRARDRALGYDVVLDTITFLFDNQVRSRSYKNQAPLIPA